MDINAPVCGTTALSLCLYREKPSIFELLLCHRCTRNRIDVNRMSKDDKLRVEPPLITACRLGNKNAVRLLIASGSDVDCVDSYQHSALWMATRQRHADLVTLLLQNGATVNPSPKWTHSPLFFAVKYSSHRTEIARQLIYNGADVGVQSNTSLLYCAIVQGDVGVAKLIVEAGYNVSKDERIRQESRSETLTRNPELLSWFDEELSQPASLHRQCRSVIRSHISSVNNNKHFLLKLLQLPLPKSVIIYLAIDEDAFGERYFPFAEKDKRIIPSR